MSRFIAVLNASNPAVAADIEAANGDDAATVVASWNVRYSDDFVAAANENYRDGEPWDFPAGCFHSGIEGDESPLSPDADTDGGPLVADNGQTDTATQTFGWVDANADGVLDVAP
jgi:hypothetical protein